MPSRYILSEPAAAAVRDLVARSGGSSDADPAARFQAPPGEYPPFTVRIRKLQSGLRRLQCYVPFNGAALVTVNGAGAVAAPATRYGDWIDIAAEPSALTIVYLIVYTIAGTSPSVYWRLAPRTSNYTPSGPGNDAALVMPNVRIARVEADGVVRQLSSGALTLSTHYVVRSSSSAVVRLLDGSGAVAAEITTSGTTPSVSLAGALSVAGDTALSGGLSVPAGKTATFSGELAMPSGSTLRVSGDVYAPAVITDGNGNSITVLAKQ